MKIWAYLALAALLIGAATGYTHWVYEKGRTDLQAEIDRAALKQAHGALEQADKQSRVDEALALAVAVDVQAISTNTAARRDTIARADLTPAPPVTTGGHDAAPACPDVLSGRFVRLFNGTDDAPPPAPAPSTSAGGVPPRG